MAPRLHAGQPVERQLDRALRHARELLAEALNHPTTTRCDCGQPECLTTRIRAELSAGGL